MKKYAGYVLMFIWYNFVFYSMMIELVPNRILNAVAEILLLSITFELTRRTVIYRDGSDDKNFIKKWKVKHSKGQLNFVILNGIIIAIYIGILIGIYVLTNDFSLASQDILFDAFICLLTGFVLSLTSWSVNDKKYMNLKEKE